MHRWQRLYVLNKQAHGPPCVDYEKDMQGIKMRTVKHSRSKKWWVCERSWIFWGKTTPASKMSLTATLMMRMLVLVRGLRPAYFASFTCFQMHAITDTLLVTETHTQIDNNAIHNSSNTDIDDVISQLLRSDNSVAETADLGGASLQT